MPPDSPDNQLLSEAVAYHAAGRFAEAERIYRDLLSRNPRNVSALHLLGVLAHQSGHPEDALRLIEQSIALQPGVASFYNNLGEALRALEQYDRAIAAYQRSLKLDPNNVDTHSNLALAYESVERFAAAIPHNEAALRSRPDDQKLQRRLARNLFAAGRVADAKAMLHQAARLDPSSFEAEMNLGLAMFDFGFLGEAASHFRRAVALRPELAGPHNNLGNVLSLQGEVAQSLAEYRRALELEPGTPALHSNLIFFMLHDPDATPKALRAECEQWTQRHAPPIINASFDNTKDPNRRLRVGYVSSDFGTSAAGYFIEAILAGHHRDAVTIKCYSNVRTPDADTRAMQQLADEWSDVAALPDDNLAELIRRDSIDILVDLSVHSRGNRLPVFAQKPSPVQVTYLGYPQSTGLPAIDYRITDIHLDPPGVSREDQVEKLIRLPETYFCYPPPRLNLPLADPPAASRGRITFGSFNKGPKMTEPTIELWSRVLNAVPRSTLFMRAQGLQDEPTQELFRQKFAKHGIGSHRLEMHGYTPRLDYMNSFNRVDIALDPVTFNGGTTSLHGLWMGVPLITLAGQTPLSRMGVSLLTNLELPELIAMTRDEYVEKAVALAANVERLKSLRRRMRGRMLASPLMNRERFIGHLEKAYRLIWQNWCAGNPAADLSV